MGNLNKKQKAFWIIWLLGIIIASVLLSIFATSCTQKTQPQITYKEIVKIDTIFNTICRVDTIKDCEELSIKYNDLLYRINEISNWNDVCLANLAEKDKTIIDLSKNGKLRKIVYKNNNNNNNNETINLRRSILLKDNIIDSLNLALKSVQKARDNSAIGNDNQLKKTTKKTQWWWIFIAGFLSAHLFRILLKRFTIFT